MWPTYVERVLPPLFTFQVDSGIQKQQSPIHSRTLAGEGEGRRREQRSARRLEQEDVSPKSCTTLCAAEISM